MSSEDNQKFEVNKKSDVVKVIKAVHDYLNGNTVEQGMYEFLETESGMKLLMDKIRELYSRQEFINMVDVVDPSNREMWDDIFNEFENLTKEDVAQQA